MSKSTTLAQGYINASDQLTILLVQTEETPPVVLLLWPPAPTVANPVRFGAVRTAIAEILDEAWNTLPKAIRGER